MNLGFPGGGSVPTATILDYLQPEINRPDLYEQQSFIVKDIRGPSASQMNKSDVTILYTIGIIILSAVIFITFVSWADVLRSYFDSKYINPIIETQTKARIYYAITITLISLIIVVLLFWAWLYFKRRR